MMMNAPVSDKGTDLIGSGPFQRRGKFVLTIDLGKHAPEQIGLSIGDSHKFLDVPPNMRMIAAIRSDSANTRDSSGDASEGGKPEMTDLRVIRAPDGSLTFFSHIDGYYVELKEKDKEGRQFFVVRNPLNTDQTKHLVRLRDAANCEVLMGDWEFLLEGSVLRIIRKQAKLVRAIRKAMAPSAAAAPALAAVA